MAPLAAGWARRQPERLREEYGLRWGPGRSAVLDALSPTMRFLLPLLPDSLRLLPQARAAKRRLRSEG